MALSSTKGYVIPWFWWIVLVVQDAGWSIHLYFFAKVGASKTLQLQMEHLSSLVFHFGKK